MSIVYMPNIIDFIHPIVDGYYIINLYFIEFMFRVDHAGSELWWGLTSYINNQAPLHIPLGFNYIAEGIPTCMPNVLVDYTCYPPGNARGLADRFIYQLHPDFLDLQGQRFREFVAEHNIPFRQVVRTAEHQEVIAGDRLNTTRITFFTWKYILFGSIMFAVYLYSSQGQLIQPVLV